MLLTKIYNEETKTEKAWFDSSMIVFTKMIEDPENNYGDLYITFKGGNTYVYHKVLFEDYMVFIAGGTDGSHGKTINKIIKGKYEFEKLAPVDLNEINTEYRLLLEEREKERIEIENSPIRKWEILTNQIEAIYKHMKDTYEVNNGIITNEQYDDMVDYLKMMFGGNDDI